MGMSIDEAIKHAEEVAEEKEKEAQDLEYSKLDWRYEANQCSECATEHRQLAEWLRKYQKIEQIMKKRYGRYYIEIVQEIKEVIEDE